MAKLRLSTHSGFGLPRRALLGALGLLLLGQSRSARAAGQEAPAFRVIVHPTRPERGAPRSFVADAFLKKVTRWADGEVLRPVDLRPQAAARLRFTERVLKRSIGAVRSYWQQRIFSGRDVPPPEVDSDEAVVAFVSKSAGAIGYVSGTAKLQGVRELAIE
jgi:hypothetical protein